MPISISEKKGQGKQKPQARGGRSRPQEIAIFTKQFSVMLEAGLPLVQSLGILADQQETVRPWHPASTHVREDVEAGSTLAEAMRKHPKDLRHTFRQYDFRW